jgi:4,5:9,10-diseco-3-hydroxy-5,9,17-trioxoandrosta-1(10),2-diene-4-oate hydrolase
VQGRVLYSEINGVRIAYTRTGQGRPIVCLHAIGHGGRDYEAFTQLVGADYEVIVVDWPNHGGSGDDVQPTSAARYAQVLVGLLDQLGIEAPILVGNSIGGAAAIIAASQREVAALVLCDSGGLVAVNGFVRATTRLFATFFNAGAQGARWFGWAYRQYYRWMILPSAAAAAQRERIIGAGYESAATLRDAWQSFGRSDADLRQAAAGLEVPILVAWAARDQVIPLWMCRPAIRKLQRAELLTFKAGHAVFLERPEAFVAAFRVWVSGVSFSAASIAASGDVLQEA